MRRQRKRNRAELPYLHQALLAYGHPEGLYATFLDPGVISPTNGVRQPFSQSEVGLHKSVVLANRLNMFWGLDWEGIPETDRLNALFTPAGWTRKYTIHTSASFERSKDQKIVAKVLVTCELTIFGLGSHSATGEEWADDDNACTSAEAQSFKRACACLGLGRYLYYFTGTWVDLDDRKRPKTVPQLTGCATPAGWLEGLRPSCAREQKPSERTGGGNGQHNGGASVRQNAIFQKIEQIEQLVGKRMHRGLLKNVTRVWNPIDIQDPEMQQKALAHMQAAERGLRRAEAARERAGLAAFAGVLGVFEIELTWLGGQSQNTPGDRGSARSGSTKS